MTKFAGDAEKEFRIANNIRIACKQEGEPEDIGIFPVDDIVCNVHKNHLGLHAEEIIHSCQESTGGQLLDKELPLCAIQYPLFNNTLDKFLIKTNDRRYLSSIGIQLMKKLKVLHSHGCFHMDIKETNIAYYYNEHNIPGDFRFADWGLSLCYNNVKLDDFLLGFSQRCLQQHFIEYYVRLGGPMIRDLYFDMFPHLFDNVDIDSLVNYFDHKSDFNNKWVFKYHFEENYATDYNMHTLKNICKFLSIIDLICLRGACLDALQIDVHFFDKYIVKVLSEPFNGHFTIIDDKSS